MTKAEALSLLSELGSHGAANEAEAHAVCDAFGVRRCKIRGEKANVHPKGYLDPKLPPGTVVKVIGGWALAEAVAYQLGYKPTRDYFGRGPRFRDALEFLKQATP